MEENFSHLGNWKLSSWEERQIVLKEYLDEFSDVTIIVGDGKQRKLFNLDRFMCEISSRIFRKFLDAGPTFKYCYEIWDVSPKYFEILVECIFLQTSWAFTDTTDALALVEIAGKFEFYAFQENVFIQLLKYASEEGQFDLKSVAKIYKAFKKFELSACRIVEAGSQYILKIASRGLDQNLLLELNSSTEADCLENISHVQKKLKKEQSNATATNSVGTEEIAGVNSKFGIHNDDDRHILAEMEFHKKELRNLNETLQKLKEDFEAQKSKAKVRKQQLRQKSEHSSQKLVLAILLGVLCMFCVPWGVRKWRNPNLDAEIMTENTKFEASAPENLGKSKCELLPEDCLRLLPEPSVGSSFNGKTIEQISRAVRGDETIAIEIKNYSNMSLSNYKHHLDGCKTVLKAPAIINAKTSEVFTFKDKPYWPEGAFLYRADGTKLAIHVNFHSSYPTRWLAIAFLSDFTNSQLVFQAYEGDVQTTNPDAFATSDGMVSNNDEEIILTVREGDLHARANIHFISRGKSLLTIELWRL